MSVLWTFEHTPLEVRIEVGAAGVAESLDPFRQATRIPSGGDHGYRTRKNLNAAPAGDHGRVVVLPPEGTFGRAAAAWLSRANRASILARSRWTSLRGSVAVGI
jgi:hypothetical protein